MLVAAQATVAETPPPAAASTAQAMPGSSRETAIKVASVAQEYEYLDKAGYRPGRQTLILGKHGQAFDVLAARHAQTGEEREFWFDISSFYGREFGF